MILINISLTVSLLMASSGFSLHQGSKRVDKKPWEGREIVIEGTLNHLARSNNGNFNGHLNDSIDIRVYDRMKDSKNLTVAFNEIDISEMRVYNVGVLMASHLGKWTGGFGEQGSYIKWHVLDSPFDLERCGPAVDLALEEINRRFLGPHNIRLVKKKGR